MYWPRLLFVRRLGLVRVEGHKFLTERGAVLVARRHQFPRDSVFAREVTSRRTCRDVTYTSRRTCESFTMQRPICDVMRQECVRIDAGDYRT